MDWLVRVFGAEHESYEIYTLDVDKVLEFVCWRIKDLANNWSTGTEVFGTVGSWNMAVSGGWIVYRLKFFMENTSWIVYGAGKWLCMKTDVLHILFTKVHAKIFLLQIRKLCVIFGINKLRGTIVWIYISWTVSDAERRDGSSCNHCLRMVAREVRLVSVRLLFMDGINTEP